LRIRAREFPKASTLFEPKKLRQSSACPSPRRRNGSGRPQGPLSRGRGRRTE
jgi:hypothetical protein